MSSLPDSYKSYYQDPATWRALTVFASYRLFLATVLFLVFYLRLPPEFLGEADPRLYSFVSLAYFLSAFVLLILTLRHWREVQTQIRLQAVIDIIALIVIIHASGGLHTGLGSLMLVVVVAGGALMPGRLAAFIAALATLAVLLEVSYSQIAGDGVTKYSQAGILGATFFVTAWLAQWLSKKLQTSQVLAEERARDVENLAVLNQHIISQMHTGVLALDSQGNVTMLNASARQLLGIPDNNSGFNLRENVPELGEQVWLWQQHSPNAFLPFQARADLPEVQSSATQLDSGEILIYIENTSALAQQAQQLKLASLGRLTASIAHEIRNPLGAISHAGELLAEQYAADHMMTKLTSIILKHTQRVNNIIETILQMSRRKTAEPSMLVLNVWLSKFIREFSDIKQADEEDISLEISTSDIHIAMDPEQLHQVIWNLMDNAWFHANQKTKPCIKVIVEQQNKQVCLDIVDNGPGVPEDVQTHLFEPFHSARQGGTGLGLYLARELCQANGARLNYIHDELNKGFFRISFPSEWQEIVKQ